MVTLEFARARLAANAAAFAALMESVTDEQARWKPVPEEWSMLEVLCHLYDEEREDFRTRVDLTLHHPELDWPSINPRGWVTERGYNQRGFQAARDAFALERQKSLKWLGELQNPNWESTHTHPHFGSATAGEMLAAWVAHDHLHLRQLNQLHWQWLARSAPPGSLEYAGGW